MSASASDSATTHPPELRAVTPTGILAEHLSALLRKAQSNRHIDGDFRAQLQKAQALAAGLEPYVRHCTFPQSESLRKLAEKSSGERWANHFSDGMTLHALEGEMLSGHTEGQFLKFLIAISQARNVLEIGMFTGYSALAMAEALSAEGRVVACELDPFAAEFAQQCFDDSPHGKKIEVAVGPALETMRQLNDHQQQFDLVFIDADKRGYIDYYNLLLDSTLLSDRGFICVDNTLMQGQPYLQSDGGMPTENGLAIKRFNQWVVEDPRVEQVLLPIRDGVTLIRRVCSQRGDRSVSK